jgi:hypothetical protein
MHHQNMHPQLLKANYVLSHALVYMLCMFELLHWLQRQSA